MNDQQISAASLREQQCCPEWCDGNDHDAVWQELGEPGSVPEHFAYIASGQRWDVVLTASMPTGGTTITITSRGDDDTAHVSISSASVARSVAAALTRAADVTEFGLATAVTR